MSTIEYDKAIRDRIPEIIKASGKESTVLQVSEQEFLAKLIEKLGEEATECQANPCLEELADMVEVIKAIVDLMGHSWQDLEQVREQKAQARGAFEKRLLLRQVKG